MYTNSNLDHFIALHEFIFIDPLNCMGAFVFSAYTFQLTTITDHSTTLIDNSFFNFIEYFIITGNAVYNPTDHLPNLLFVLNKFKFRLTLNKIV